MNTNRRVMRPRLGWLAYYDDLKGMNASQVCLDLERAL
jgi:hypothetical protein